MATTRARLPSRYAKPALVAHGGMGDVHRATDERLGRTVAIKLLAERHAVDDEFRARFLREARTAASLSGEPYVITIHDVGETDDGLPFIVMEYAPGGTLADRLRAGDVSPGRALDWLEQSAIALDAAHARGVVHRDVKPANLLLASDGTVRVTDFGIARAAGEDTLTAVGTVLGSAGYMAPEQARGEPITPATDRYALACVAFELLTGRRPFARESQAAELAAHASEPTPSVSTIDPGLPTALDAVFARGLAKDPADRHASGQELVDDLRMAIHGPPTLVATSVTAPGPVPVARHAARPRYGLALLIAAALIAAGGLLGWLLSATSDGSSTTGTGAVVERTVTERAATTAPARTAAPAPTAAPAESASALNDRAFRLLQQGRPRQALPLLEAAVARLQGRSTLTEAYASFNLAWARFAVGRCDGVLALLDRSEAIQGHRAEIDRLRDEAAARCGGGDDADEGEGDGRGKGRGKGKGKD